MSKICFGCGVKLQSDDKDKNGYVPLNKIKDASYCMRCFRMTHYGEVKVVNTPKDQKEIINKINKDNKHVIFLVDFLNINNKVIDIFKSIKKDKLLVVNKCELIPKHVYKMRIIDYLQNYYGIDSPIKLKGGVKSHGAKSILDYLKKNNIKESYILGISNSGKSTLINDLMDICSTKNNKITVNSKSNTTIDFIRVKLNDEYTLIDSPGFIIGEYLDVDVSTKNITAYSMNMKECETLSLLDGKYFMKFSNNTPIVFYTNGHAKKQIKKYYKAAPNLKTIINVEDNTDIIIYGVGFVTIKKACEVTLSVDKKNIEIRKSLFGWDK